MWAFSKGGVNGIVLRVINAVWSGRRCDDGMGYFDGVAGIGVGLTSTRFQFQRIPNHPPVQRTLRFETTTTCTSLNTRWAIFPSPRLKTLTSQPS